MKMSFDVEAVVPNGKVVLDLSLPELKIGERVLARNIELNVTGPRKVAIVGKNGIGKTTLIREMKDIIEETEGINLGYMPQNYGEVLNSQDIVLDYLLEDLEGLDISTISAYMGRIKLTWQEMNGEIGELSYGQRAKLMILKMMLSGKNVLLFDEPTRNLSSLSNPVIREMLKNYKGAIIGVSHDRKFLKEVCDIVYKLDENGLKEVTF